MQSTTSSNKSPNHNYSPAVPISVYRELATELQTVEAKLDSITAQNQQLAKQNQQLRYELETAVNSVLYLQQVVNSGEVGKRTYTYYPTNEQPESNREVKQTTPRSRASTAVQAKVKTSSSVMSEPDSVAKTEFTEQEQHRYRHRNEVPPEVGSWRLAIAIMLIMITAFGAGYFIVRPLLPSR